MKTYYVVQCDGYSEYDRIIFRFKAPSLQQAHKVLSKALWRQYMDKTNYDSHTFFNLVEEKLTFK